MGFIPLLEAIDHKPYYIKQKKRLEEIRKAETDLELFNKLMKEYKNKKLFNRKNRENNLDSIHNNISPHEVFINDEDAVVI